MEDKITDMEVVLFLREHIENPCNAIVNGKEKNIRYFYLDMAEEVIPKLTNPFAREYLQGMIDFYN